MASTVNADEKPRRRRVGVSGLEMLVAEVEDRPSLHHGHGADGKQQKELEWKEAAERLNQISVQKTANEWKQSWQTLVRRVREKNSRIAGNPDASSLLSERESRVLAIIGLETSEGVGEKSLGGLPGDDIAANPIPQSVSDATESLKEEEENYEDLCDLTSPEPLLPDSPRKIPAWPTPPRRPGTPTSSPKSKKIKTKTEPRLEDSVQQMARTNDVLEDHNAALRQIGVQITGGLERVAASIDRMADAMMAMAEAITKR